jgi:hypothetical protein
MIGVCNDAFSTLFLGRGPGSKSQVPFSWRFSQLWSTKCVLAPSGSYFTRADHQREGGHPPYPVGKKISDLPLGLKFESINARDLRFGNSEVFIA